MQFLIVSDLGRCNIWQVFNTDTPVTTDCKQETETNCEQVYDNEQLKKILTIYNKEEWQTNTVFIDHVFK